MLIKEDFVVMCCYLYIQRLSKIAVSISIFPTTCVFLWENMTIAVYEKQK